MHDVLTHAHASVAQHDCQQLGLVMPSAILAAAEKAAEAKEQLTRRRQLPHEAHIFADGFAIGMAFVMEVNQGTVCCTVPCMRHIPLTLQHIWGSLQPCCCQISSLWLCSCMPAGI